jgi:UDP-N-acetylmuramate--alanine ligase
MPPKTTPLKKPSIHFVGIGGIGISALARWFLAQNWAVSGSDVSKSLITQELIKDGVKVKIGHKKKFLPVNSRLVIHTQAIGNNNPELKSAKDKNIPVLSYPQVLGQIAENYKIVAISGSHGKSTTTAFISLILTKAKFDPTVIIGTKLKEFDNKNFRLGKGSYLVIEADEYKAAFLNYSPIFTIVTNIDKEHLDFYKNLSGVKKSFLEFLSRTKNGGALILNRDDKNLYSLKSKIQHIAKNRSLRVIWFSIKSQDIHSDSKNIQAILQIPGSHNVSNALAALTLAKLLKIKSSVALKAIGNYRGSWRRMEYRGILRISNFKFHVYDDYAHHPTEIKATLRSFKEKFPNKNLICVFQPHQAERLTHLFKEFQTAFNTADIAVVLPTYQVIGRDLLTNSRQVRKYSSESLVKAIQKKNPRKLIFYLDNPQNLKKAISTIISSPAPFPRTNTLSHKLYLKNSIIVMMGAGDIVNYTAKLISNVKQNRVLYT